GLMISAFAKASAALGEPRYLDAAQQAAQFVLGTMREGGGREAGTGVLLRRYRDGEAAIPGFLDDYAFFVQALLDLYEASFSAQYLVEADALTRQMLARFEDPGNGGFFSTAEGDPSLVLRIKDDYDGAEPSGNSVALMNLLRLAEITNDDLFRRAAART